jgi:hypothetical protein
MELKHVVSATCACMLSCTALGEVITVDDDLQDFPGADYTLIWDAILAAQPHDEILVYPGVYTDPGWPVADIIKPLTLRSVAGPLVTFLRGSGAMDVGPEGISVKVSNVLVDGFTIDGCQPTFDLYGLAVTVNSDTEDVELRNCIVTGAVPTQSMWEMDAAVYCAGNSTLIVNCTISNNDSVGIDGTEATLINSVVCGNSADEQVGPEVVIGEGSCVSESCITCITQPCDGTNCDDGSGLALHVPKDFATISSALAAAGPCDRIIIAPGIYDEALIDTEGRSVSLEPAGPARSVTIRPPVFNVQGCYFPADDSFSRFELHGIVLDGSNANAPMTTNSTSLIMDDCEIINWNTASVLMFDSGYLTIVDTDVHSNATDLALINSLSHAGDGYWNDAGSKIRFSSFYNNDAPLLVRAGYDDAQDFYECRDWAAYYCCDTPNEPCCFEDGCTYGSPDCDDSLHIQEGLIRLFNNTYCVGAGGVVAAQEYIGPDCFEPYQGIDDNDCNCNGVANHIEINVEGAEDCNEDGIPDSCEWDDGTAVDCDGDGVIDSCAIDQGVVSDCNDNGIPDACDIDNGNAMDCNGNGTPDSCEPDCNNNGQPDDCDVSDGDPDCNGNGTPDICDIASGVAIDCNGNSVPDACDLDAGEPDRNANGIPDSCDIHTGVLMDCDGDMMPDLWQRPRPRCGLDVFYLVGTNDLLLDVGIADVGHGVIVGVLPTNEVITWNLDPSDPFGHLPDVAAQLHDACRTFNYQYTWTICPEIGAPPLMTQLGNKVLAADGIGFVKPFIIEHAAPATTVTFDVFRGGSGEDGEPGGGEGPGSPGVPPGEDQPPTYWSIGEGARWPTTGTYAVATGLNNLALGTRRVLGGTTPGGGEPASTGTRVGDGSGGYPGLDDWQDSVVPTGRPYLHDLNGDGLDDLMIPFASEDGGGVQWFMATGVDLGADGADPDGDGFPGGVQWSAPQTFTTSYLEEAHHVTAGDIDGDGMQEILIGARDVMWMMIIQLDANGNAQRGAATHRVQLDHTRGSLEHWAVDLINVVGDDRPELVSVREDYDASQAVFRISEFAGPYTLRRLDTLSVNTDGPMSLQAAHVGRPGAGPTGLFAGASGDGSPFAAQIGPRGLLADITDDGLVGIDDLLLFIESYGGDDLTADLNRNGEVDINDLLILLDDYNAVYEGP